jgi:hypothetical protein
MPSEYHNNVEIGIKEFGKLYKRFKKICGGNIPIPINHPTQRMRPILYHPDVYFVTKFGGLFIFEILDSELNDENLVIADILLACLSPNAKKVFFIVPKEEVQEKINDLAVTIIDNLVSKGISNKELPNVVATIYILENEALTSENVKKVLINSAVDRGVTI